MGFEDLIITPLYLILFYILAYILKPYVTDRFTKQFFLPALTLKFFGAIALGLIYEFYYGYGGDTFNYYYKPGALISNSFWTSPVVWLKLLISNGEYDPTTFGVASRIFTYSDQPTFFVARFVGLFGVVSFNSYYSIALFFAAFSFSGVWALYLSFYKLYPKLRLHFAIACLFLPSLWFWGSGILKDTITFGALGWLVFALFSIIIHKNYSIWNFLVALVASFVIYSIKIYILLCLVPPLIYWVVFRYAKQFRNPAIKIMLFPFLLILTVGGGYFAIREIGENNPRYSLETLSYTAESTARWLAYVGEQSGGSIYTLGDYDFSIGGIIRKIPFAIWTSLFRPHLWEAGNPVMFLSALENFFLFIVMVYTLWKIGFVNFFKRISLNPFLGFCFIFSLTFAFAIGFSTYNFGSLVRYRIPLIPFFLGGLFVLNHFDQRENS